jgi:putative ABC transport system ATP-binding protein
MSVTPLVSARDVHRDYARAGSAVHAVRGVTIDVASGEYVAIVGPSGCGKSTLLNLLGAIDRPTTGSVSVGGVVVSGLPDRDATRFRLTRIGFVFQRFYLLPMLSASENIELRLRAHSRIDLRSCSLMNRRASSMRRRAATSLRCSSS